MVRSQPELRRKALVLVEERAQQVRVIAASPTAQRLGVVPGMNLASARALVPELPALPFTPKDDRQALEGLGLWAQWLAPFTACFERDAIAIEISGCTHLHGGEEAAMREAQMRLASMGWCAQAACADTPRAAYLLAGMAELAGKGEGEEAPDYTALTAPPGCTEKSLARLPIESLSLGESTLESLEDFGVRTLQHLLGLSRSQLISRFGSELNQRLGEILGEVTEPLEALTGDAPLAEEIRFEQPLEDGLHFVLKRLCDRLGEALHGAGAGTCELALSFFHEGADATHHTVRASEAIGSAKGLLLLLTTYLESHPLKRAIEGARLQACSPVNLSARDANLFSPRKGPREAGLHDLFDRLSARLGASFVTRAELIENHQPELAWQSAPVLDAKAPDDSRELPLRPLRVFEEPVPVVVTLRDDSLFALNRHRLLRTEGPERLGGNWWRENFSRDYYRVELDTGDWYWIFRERTTGAFYWQGVFA